MERNATSLHMRVLFAFALSAVMVLSFTPTQTTWANQDTPATNGTALSAAQIAGDSSSADDALALSDQAAGTPQVRYSTKTVGASWQNDRKNGKTAGSTKGASPLKAMKASVSGTPAGAIQYQVHVAGGGWNAAKSNSATAAATGSKGSIDAVRMVLTGELSKTYSVAYRVNTSQSGWQQWTTDGSIAGTVNKGSSIRALKVKLVKKSSPTAAGKGIIGIRYRMKQEQTGWSTWASNNAVAGTTKKALGAQGLQVSVDRGIYQGGLSFRTHSISGAWSSWKRGGSQLTFDDAIDAVQVKLSGALSKKYSVEYRAYVQGVGWQRKMYDGDTAGTEGLNMKIQALRIKLVSKKNVSGWVRNGSGSFSYYQAGKPLANTWIVTDKHPVETTLTSGLQRYWIDANGVLAVDRYIDPNSAADSDAGWTAYATPSGFVGRGKFTNSSGQLLLADNEGSLYTETQWLTTDAFDGSSQRYRLVKKGVCAVVQTGLFTVDGKKYYGWPDGRGYLMRSTMKCIGKNWYKANANGVLKDYTKKMTNIIERYVAWAIDIANDESHGYSQYERWGPDYDCSSFVCSALLAAGFPESGASWTGNMKAQLKTIGFVWHKGTAGLQRGDIMLVHNDLRQHTEIYLGNNQLVGAHIAETGTIYGEAGDQTGNEISVTTYYNAPWDGYLRYKG